MTTTCHDRLTDKTFTVRSKFLIGADGGNSQVAEHAGLPFEGKMGVGGSMNILFRADLSRYVAHRPSVLYWVMQPGADVGGIGMGLVRMVRPWNEWLIVWGYDINQPAPKVDEAMATQVARQLVGDPELEIELISANTWTVNNMYATHMQNKRVFIMGDAAHRHPPSNGLGSNTSIQDSFNLAWKLAMVVKGQAGRGAARKLFAGARADRQADRHPRQPVDRRVRPDLRCPRHGWRRRLREDPAQHGCARRQGREGGETARGAAQGDRVQEIRVRLPWRRDEPALPVGGGGWRRHARSRNSSAIANCTTTRPPGRARAFRMCGYSTSRARSIRRSILCGKGSFTILTGIGGEGWADAAKAVAEKLGVEVKVTFIGPRRDYEDFVGDWARAREVRDSGCVLVRPDQHVAWRSQTSWRQPDRGAARRDGENPRP